jgi:hypothetical protein
MTYPGSKRPTRANRAAAAKAAERAKAKALKVSTVNDAWDARPIVKTIDGIQIEFFTIGSLAKALGRRVDTIRKMIYRGILPRERWRTDGQGPVGQNRVWTRAQIEGIVRIAREEGVLHADVTTRFESTDFTARVRELFDRLEDPNR